MKLKDGDHVVVYRERDEFGNSTTHRVGREGVCIRTKSRVDNCALVKWNNGITSLAFVKCLKITARSRKPQFKIEHGKT